MKPATAIITLLLTLPLAACGEDTPPVCNSVVSLKASVEDVKKVELTKSGGLEELKDGLSTVASDLAAVKVDAKSEFAFEINEVEVSLATLKVSVEAAVSTPTAGTLTEAGSALSIVGTNVKALVSEIETTC